MKTIASLNFLIIIVLNFDIINSGKLLNTITNKNSTTTISTNTTTTNLPFLPEKKQQIRATITKNNGISSNSNINSNISSKNSTFENSTTNTNVELKKLSTTTKKTYPKKYIPPSPINSSNTENGPTKIVLAKSVPNSITDSLNNDEDELRCPKESEAQYNLFAPSCETDRDCNVLQKEQKCCKIFGSNNCIKGIPKPAEDQPHNPLLGFIPRRCPQIPLAELWWDLKQCETDNECWPRICCPDGHLKFCRAPTIEYNSMPVQLGRPLSYLIEYLECTPPPPVVFDLHPKKCESTFDCFPNVCCQEIGKKHCRPPKKSVLTFMANFLNIGLVKRLTANIVIK